MSYGGDYSGFGYAAQVKPKTWTTAPFVSEFCDSIAGNLSTKPSASQSHTTFKMVVRHLLRKCGPAGELGTQAHIEEEERRREAAAAIAADGSAQAAAAGDSAGGVTVVSVTRRRREQRAKQNNADKLGREDKEADFDSKKEVGQLPGDIQGPAARALHRLRHAVRRAEALFKKFDEFQTWRLQFYISKIADDAARLIQGLRRPGDLALLPLFVPENVVMLVEYVDAEYCRATLVNPSTVNDYHPKTVDPAAPSKVKANVAMTLTKVPLRRIQSEAWWSMVMLASMTGIRADVYYTHFCSWLTGADHEAQVDLTRDGMVAYATPAKSDRTTFWKSLVHVLKYVLRSEGLQPAQVKLVRHYVKRRLLEYAVRDLEDAAHVKFSTKQLVEHAAKNAAASVSRNARMMPAAELAHARGMVDRLSARLERLRCEDEEVTEAPPQLDVTNGWHLVQQPDSFPLAECLRRTEGVDKFAGQAMENPRTVPTNFLRVSSRVETFDEALAAVDEAVTVIMRLATCQRDVVRNVPLLVSSLAAHLLIEVLPVPLGPATRAAGRQCIWSDSPLRYGQQLHLLKRLQELVHLCVQGRLTWAADVTTEGLMMTVHAAAMTIADAVIRVPGTDKMCLWTKHYAGLGGSKHGQYAVGLGPYAEQSEVYQFLYPEALLARAHILDYFAEVHEATPAANVIWKWEKGMGAPDRAGSLLLRHVALSEAMPTHGVPATMLVESTDGMKSLLLRQNPELRHFRDLVFWFKLTLRHESQVGQEDYLSAQDDTHGWAESLQLQYEGEYTPYILNGQEVSTQAKVPTGVSYAMPSRYTGQHKADTENDILHIQNIVAFEDTMGQRDVELLLSYLTVPYMRIPLVLRFLATEDRVSTLRSKMVQQLLQSVLFDAGRFLDRGSSGVSPEEVPTLKPELIGAAHGLLLNELWNAPLGVVDPILRLCELAAELDPGTVFNESSTDVSLFLVRTIARVLSFVTLALDVAEEVSEAANGEAAANAKAVACCPSLATKSFGEIRDVAMQNRDVLRACLRRLSDYTKTKSLVMLHAWIDETSARLATTVGKASIDEVTAIAVRLHAHIVLLLRPVKADEMDEAYVTRFLSSFMFITSRYTWNRNVLPEAELYGIVQRQRRHIVAFLSRATQGVLSRVMDAVVRIVTGSEAADVQEQHRWGYVAGGDTMGRFARLDDDIMRKQRESKATDRAASLEAMMDGFNRWLGVDSLAPDATVIREGLQEVELNIQSLSLTFKATHLQALPSDALTADVEAVFGNRVDKLESLQCAFIESTTHRLWLRLVGQQHDIMHWRTPDPRSAVPDDKQMRFFPDDLAEAEGWIRNLFEPVRQAFFERNFWDPPVFILLPERRLTPDTGVARLTAVDSESGALMNEIYVFRDFGVTHVYDVHSFGRRFFHSLTFTSDARYCLHQLDPDVKNRNTPWPVWGRHMAGDARAQLEEDSMSVIIRHPTHPDNVSKSAETYIPARLLLGVVPTHLLNTHDFWQDADDNLRGYPMWEKDSGEERPQHLLWLHWKETQCDALNQQNTCLRIIRFPRAAAAPVASEEAVARSSFVHTTAEMLSGEAEEKPNVTKEGAGGAKEQPKRLDDDDNCISPDVQAGLFRDAPTPTRRGAKATVEDNDLLLVNLMYARQGTPLHSLALAFARLDCLSHVLVWTKAVDYDGNGPLSLDVIQLPRLKLSFTARLAPSGGEYRIFSLDHAHLFVSNDRPALVTQLLQGVPHSLIMADVNSAYSILVPSFDVVRPVIASAPFTTSIVVHRGNKKWYEKLDTRYYLYPVHVSLSFVFTPTLASALYLLLLRFYNRRYADVYHLAGTIGTDMELSLEESQIFNRLAVPDVHPDAHACRAKIALLTADSPVHLSFFPPTEVAQMLVKSNEVSVSCRMTPSEEKRLLHVCDMILVKMQAIRDYVIKRRDPVMQARDRENGGIPQEASMIVGGALGNLDKIGVDMRRGAQRFADGLISYIRETLDIRIVREELGRLLALWIAYGRESISGFAECMLHNRKQIIDAEIAAAAAARERKTKQATEAAVQLKVPSYGKDLKWLSYTGFDALSTKPFGSCGTLINSELQAVSMSPRMDYYYCNQSCRKHNQCHCRGCNESCGPQNGCPCTSCERFNDREGKKVRQLLQTLDSSKTARQLSFFEVFSWMTEVLRSHTKFTPRRKMFLEKETPMSLRVANNSFIRYYECCTGTTKVKIAQQNCASDVAELLFHFSREARMPCSGIGHMAHFVVQTPRAWHKLTKFQRGTRVKPEQVATNIYNSIWSVAATFRDAKQADEPMPEPDADEGEENRSGEVPAATGAETVDINSPVEDAVSRFLNLDLTVPLRTPSRTPETPLHMTTALPRPRDTNCSRRVLKVPKAEGLVLLGEEEAAIRVTGGLLAQLQGQPLGAVFSGDEIVVFRDRKEQGMEPVAEDLPFQLRAHDGATKSVARNMLNRLETDMCDFASEANDAMLPKLAGMASRADATSVFCGQPTPMSAALRRRLELALGRLEAMRSADVEYVAVAVPVITRTANFIDMTSDDGDQEAVATSTLLRLRRFAGREATLGLEYLIASLCSTTAEAEWKDLNPFLDATRCDSLMALVAVTVLRANRIGHVNRASEQCKELLGMVASAEQFPASWLADAAVRATRVEALVASAVQKADALAAELTTARCFIDEDFTYDPRFLLFEFTWNLVIRRRQRSLIADMYGSIVKDQSIVKQMIMGAGKTTVVGPLLALMLADGEQLIIQVVPPALLDFTRSVLRTTFSTVLQKQIFTFGCDRSAEVDSEALAKFMHARDSRGIVVTTPSAVKSVFLKYVEGLEKMVDETRPRSSDAEKETADLLQVLGLWRDSVLIMDEVDMLLHPLKSELNFPIGAKHDIDFSPLRWKMPMHLIDAVFYYHTRRITTAMKENPVAFDILAEFRGKVELGLRQNALQEMPHLTLLNLEFYEKHLRPILARWALLYLKAQHLYGLSDDNTVAFLMKRPTEKQNAELLAAVRALDSDHIKVLNFTFDWLNSYMPHVLQKIDRVSFGIMNADDTRRAREEHPHMPRSRFVTAIPFVGKDLPSQSSEFAHPDIVIGLTILAYRYEGLRRTDFGQILSDLHAAVEKEVGRYSQRRTNIMYNRWVQAAGGRLLASHLYGKQKSAARDADDGMGLQPSETIAHMSETATDGGDATGVAKGCRVDILPLRLMRQANVQEVDKLFGLFKRTPEVLHWYLSESVFPEFMRHQQLKLSASGQELGGDMIFRRRIGFSGTPSDLLPVELGTCDYEKGTDGQLIHTLTDPSVVSFTVAKPGWTVRTLLDSIAESSYKALIDTGALITGMSNLQVAQYLLKHGLPNIDGVVFLDEFDRKMILVRATGRVLKLAECGIPKHRRFAFYDQVHTTGMDIEHTPNAEAVQTLGKDMTFRDLAQGAYRMRGISQGQSVNLLIIPEVYDLISRTLRSVRPVGFDPDVPLAARPVGDVLVDVTAWLLVNSIRSEHTQHNQLCLQNCANVWRKAAFQLLRNMEPFKRFKPREEQRRELLTAKGSAPTTVQDTVAADNTLAEHLAETEGDRAATDALRVFRETISFEITGDVPQPRMFSDNVAEYVEKNGALVTTPEGRAVVDRIVAQARREDEVDHPVIDVQMVQEQEEEREAEEEQEKEQEIEIEKFVDLTYSRDEEKGVSWKLSTLCDPAQAAQFYPLSEFHLYKRRPLAFPASILLSRNFFNSKWSGHRRIKNVIVTMEWIPDTGALALSEAPSLDYAALPLDGENGASERLAETVRLVAEHEAGGFTHALVTDLLNTALHIDQKRFALPQGPLDGIARRIVAAAASMDVAGGSMTAALLGALRGNELLQEQRGRFTVAVTLDEAQTLRRVVHLRNALAARADAPLDAARSVMGGKAVSVALRVAPSRNIVLDQLDAFPAAPTPYVANRDYQCLRFFDCELQYSDPEFGVLLRALHVNTEKQRQAFFQQVIACRRRARQRWERTPVANLFLLRDALTLLRQRVMGLCVKRELHTLDLNLGDAFLAFNNSHSGVLTPDEVWGAMRFCRLTNLTADDVLDFVDLADSHHEGTVLFQDFVQALTGEQDVDEAGGDGSDTQDTEANDAQKGKRLPTVDPYGADELRQRRFARIEARRAAEADANLEAETENQRVMREIENEQIADDLAQAQLAGNPDMSTQAVTYTFNGDTFPPLAFPVGPRNRMVMTDNIGDGDRDSFTRALRLANNSGLRCQLRVLKRLAETDVINNFTVSVEFKMGDAKATPIEGMSTAGTPLVLARWMTRVYRFSGYRVCGTPNFEVDMFNHPVVYPEARDLFANEEQPTSKKKKKPSSNKGTFNFAGGGGGGADGGDEKHVLHIFSEPKPTPEAAGTVDMHAFVVSDDRKLMNSIDGVTYEWMQISFPIQGWVVTARNGRGMWEQLATSINFAEEREAFMLDVGPASSTTLMFMEQPVQMDLAMLAEMPMSKEERKRLKQQRRAQRRKLFGVAAEDDSDEENSQEEDGDDEEGHVFAAGLGSEINDLLQALREAKLLKPGDKVTRNQSEWDRGDEDGGAGKVGRVLRTTGEHVEVQWPNGIKRKYDWGNGGRFELIKVGEADDGEEGDQRETFNDDRWIPDLRQGALKCTECNAPKLEPGNWFRCNHCEFFDLCKKCFRQGKHESHHFTDMGVLNQEHDKNEVNVGAPVRIKLSVVKPKFGWSGGAKAGMKGTVVEIDDDKVVSVELENGGQFRAEVTELEVLLEAAEAEDEEEQAESYPYLQALRGVAMPPTDAPMRDTEFLWLAACINGAREAARHRFQVGDNVIFFHGAQALNLSCGQATACQVRACLPRRRYELSAPQGWFSGVEEDLIQEFGIAVGDRVRIRRDVTSTRGYVPNLEALKKGQAGLVQRIERQRGLYVRLSIKWPNSGTWSLYGNEIEPLKSGKWSLCKRKVDANGSPLPAKVGGELEYETAAAVPASSNVIIERSFVDGVQHLQVFIRDDVYNVDLATGEVSQRGAVIGQVRRAPDEPFCKGEEKKRCDDSFPHVVSAVVAEGETTVVVDGRQATLEQVGALCAIVDDDVRKALTAEALAYVPTSPMMLLSTSCPGTGRDTHRIVNWCRFDFGDCETLDDVIAWHAVMEADCQWTCRECGALSNRDTDTCGGCRAPRLPKRGKDEDQTGKMRAGNVASREAAAVRTRLQGRLRAQYQRQLDAIEEAQTEEEKAKKAKKGGVAIGPAMPGA